MRYPILILALAWMSAHVSFAQVKRTYQDSNFLHTTVVVKEDSASDYDVLDAQFDLDEFSVGQVIRITTEKDRPPSRTVTQSVTSSLESRASKIAVPESRPESISQPATAPATAEIAPPEPKETEPAREKLQAAPEPAPAEATPPAPENAVVETPLAEPGEEANREEEPAQIEQKTESKEVSSTSANRSGFGASSGSSRKSYAAKKAKRSKNKYWRVKKPKRSKHKGNKRFLKCFKF